MNVWEGAAEVRDRVRAELAERELARVSGQLARLEAYQRTELADVIDAVITLQRLALGKQIFNEGGG